MLLGLVVLGGGAVRATGHNRRTWKRSNQGQRVLFQERRGEALFVRGCRASKHATPHSAVQVQGQRLLLQLLKLWSAALAAAVARGGRHRGHAWSQPGQVGLPRPWPYRRTSGDGKERGVAGAWAPCPANRPVSSWRCSAAASTD